jgi:hypothetical protein
MGKMTGRPEMIIGLRGGVQGDETGTHESARTGYSVGVEIRELCDLNLRQNKGKKKIELTQSR